MSINNSVIMKQSERKKMIIRFRTLYKEIDNDIEALDNPGRYTFGEYKELCRHYRLIQGEADELEDRICRHFSHKDLFFKIRWFKSNPHDGRVASRFVENPYFPWNESEAQKALDERERINPNLEMEECE